MKYYIHTLAVLTLCLAGDVTAQDSTHVLDLVNARTTSDAEYAAVPDERALLINVPPRPPRPGGPWLLPVTTAMVALDQGTYVVGDDIVYEFIVRNSGSGRIYVPQSRQAHLFTNKMPGAVRASFWLWFDDEVLGTQKFAVTSTYGSHTVAGSLLGLDPGESVRIRVKDMVLPSKHPEAPAAWLRVVNLAVGFALYPVGLDQPYGETVSTNHVAAQISSSP